MLLSFIHDFNRRRRRRGLWRSASRRAESKRACQCERSRSQQNQPTYAPADSDSLGSCIVDIPIE
jgi:hypothetical protein